MAKIFYKITDFFSNILNGFFLIIFAFVFLSNLFIHKTFLRIGPDNRMLAFVLVLLVSIILWIIGKKLLLINPGIIVFIKTYQIRCVWIFMSFLFLLQCFLIFHSYTQMNWDMGTIFNTVISDEFMPDFTNYFSYFPNNLFVTFSFRWIYELVYPISEQAFLAILVLINMLAVDSAIMMGFFLSKKLFGLKTAFIYLIIITALFGLSPWLMVPYSDTLAMPFTLFGTWVLIKLYECKKIYGKIMLLLLSGITFFVGYSIKPTTLIVLIAAFVFIFLRRCSVVEFLKYCMAIVGIFLIMISVKVTWNHYIYEVQDKMIVDESVAFPWTYWLAIGLSQPNGMCNEPDQWDTVYRGTSSRMVELHKEMVKERLLDFGVVGYAKFLVNKLQVISTEGSFFWAQEGGINSGNFDLTDSNVIKETFYPNGKYFQWFTFYTNGIWSLVLLYIIMPVFWKKSSKDQEINQKLLPIRIVIYGLLCFVLLFEARSRYLILYLPYFSILAAVGINHQLRLPGIKKRLHRSD